MFVVLFHVFYDGLPITEMPAWFHFLLPFNGGNAVLVFFLVSGFSLSIGYLTKQDLKSWTKIVAGRYFRLAIPVFVACLIVHFAMVTGILRPAPERFPAYARLLTFEPTTLHLFYTSFIGTFFNYDDAETYIGPLWAMKPELIGSFVVLFLLLFLRRLEWRIPMLLGVAALISVIIPFGSAGYVATFPIGAAIAEAYRRGWLDRMPQTLAVTTFLVGAALPLLLPPNLFNGTLSAMLLMWGAISSPYLRRLLENRSSSRLGDICFPLYLMHGPVMWIIGEPLMRNFDQGIASRLTIDLTIVVLSFVAAYAFLPVNRFAIRIAHTAGRAAATFLPSPSPTDQGGSVSR